MGIRFERCRLDQLEPLRAFFAAQYSPQHILARNAAFLEWQFGEAPGVAPDGIDVKVATVDGAIAGCVGYVPVAVRLGDRLVRGAWAANWLVDDQYRRLGLGPLLMRELCREFDVTLALGGNRDAHALLPRMGWTDFGDLNRHVAVLDRDLAAPLVEGRLEWPATLPEGARDGVRRVEQFAPSATDLWDRLSEGVAGTRRSADFLNWRYGAHPVFEYRLFEHATGGALDGFAVYRVEVVNETVRVGRMVELVAAPEQAATLIRGVIADARDTGAAMLDFFCSDPRLSPALHAEGFVAGDQPGASTFPILFQPIDRSRTAVLFMAHLPQQGTAPTWYVTTADGDQDRPN